MPINLSRRVTGLRQIIETGNSMNGVAPGGSLDVQSDKDVLAYPSDTKGGLFTFTDVKASEHVYVSRIMMNIEDGVNWSVFLTSGRRDGSGTPDPVDDPAYDMELASGYGPEVVPVDIDILPNGGLIRVTTDTVSSKQGIVTLRVTNSYAQSGRIT